MTTDKEKSFKAKLKNIALEVNRNPAALWQSIVLERFLARLGYSSHRHHFVLKGGVLLAKYIPICRETQDLDFLGIAISNDMENLKQTFDEIASLNLNDGFLFRDVKVDKLVHSHMIYAGIEVSLTGYFGRTRFPVAIDVGFGDRVEPIHKEISLTHSSKGPLFEESISLLCYPPEFIFAEKLETIVSRGGVNSRMKDFHDLHTILKAVDLSFGKLKTIIASVFEHRKTPFSVPLIFTDSDISLLQSHWKRYLSRLTQSNSQNLPLHVAEVIGYINKFLEK